MTKEAEFTVELVEEEIPAILFVAPLLVGLMVLSL